MLERLVLARIFLFGGAALLALGFLIWFWLPIPGAFPPYLVTAALALVYGATCGQLHPRPAKP